MFDVAPCSVAPEVSIATSPTEPPFKACACGLQYSEDAWKALRYVGIQEIPADETGPAEQLELRDCHCGSTLAIEVAA